MLGEMLLFYSCQSYSWVVKYSSDRHLVLDCAAFGTVQTFIDQLYVQSFRASNLYRLRCELQTFLQGTLRETLSR